MKPSPPPTTFPVHSERIIVHTAIKAGGMYPDHSEGLVVRRASRPAVQEQHNEGVVAVVGQGPRARHLVLSGARTAVTRGG